MRRPYTSDRPRSLRPRMTRVVASAAAVGVALSLGLAGAATAAAPGTVQGFVFLDFNGNGVYDTAGGVGIPVDQPIAAVTVTAYDAVNATVGSAVTGADGTYSIDTAAVADGTPLRVEFTDIPAGDFDGFHGADSGTSVQFTTAGSTEDVDFSVVHPQFYSSPGLNGSAPLVQTIQRNANRNASGGGDAANTNAPSIVSIPFGAPDNRSEADPVDRASWDLRTTLALTPQTGSVGATAFDRQRDDLYAAAELRRFADLGPAGLGAIYILEDVLDADGAIVPPASLTTPLPFIDVTALGVDVGQGIGDLSAAGRGLGDAAANPATHTARDVLGYEWAGRAGIGGIAVSSDSSTLYFVNRYDSMLYGITLPDPRTGAVLGLAGAWDLGLAAGEQASAVTVHRGQVFVGVVDTGNALTAALPGAVPDAGTATASGDMRVLRGAETDGALAAGAAFGEVLARSLSDDYSRGVPIVQLPNPASTIPDRFKVWHNWTNVWDTPTFTVLPRTGRPGVAWAQPLLSGLAFTSDDRLVLTLADRFAMQSGAYNWSPVDGDGDLYYGFSQGDMLYATPQFVLEDAGELPGLARGWTNTENLPDQGLGDGEFFDDNVSQSGWRHDENTLGWAATFPGVDEIAVSAFDPVGPTPGGSNNLDVAGVRFLSATGGEDLRGYIQTTADGGYFQKAGGLGAVTLLLAEAPVEIGNRVWLDADLNGRQDADEPAINGAPVQLFAAVDGTPTGTVLAQTTTAVIDGAPGVYYFSSLDVDGLDPHGDYVVVFGKGTGAVELAGSNATHAGFAGLDWTDLEFTRQASDLAQPTTDSNPDPATGYAPISVGGPGENDHTIDAGFVAFGSFVVEKVLDASGATPVEGQTFTIDVTAAQNFRGQDMLGQGAAYAYPEGAWDPQWEHDWTVTPTSFVFEIVGGAVVAVDPSAVPQRLPVGYTLTLAEREAADLASVAYDPADAAGTAAEILITVNGGESIVVTVTNQLLPDGSFTIRKDLAGTAAALEAAAGVSFTVVWSADSGPSGQVSITGGQTSAPITVPAGSTVTLSEVQPTSLPEGVQWTGHTWSGAGVVPTADGGATFEVASQTDVAVVLTNDVGITPEEPEEPELPVTGSTIAWSIVALGVAAIIAGTVLMAVRRRSTTDAVGAATE